MQFGVRKSIASLFVVGAVAMLSCAQVLADTYLLEYEGSVAFVGGDAFGYSVGDSISGRFFINSNLAGSDLENNPAIEFFAPVNVNFVVHEPSFPNVPAYFDDYIKLQLDDPDSDFDLFRVRSSAGDTAFYWYQSISLISFDSIFFTLGLDQEFELSDPGYSWGYWEIDSLDFPDSSNYVDFNVTYAKYSLFIADSDDDGIEDESDNCPTIPNPDQIDTNNDGYGDACVPPDVDIPDSADIGTGTVIGTGTTINAGVSVGENSTIGDDVTINKNSSIGNDAVIGDGSEIAKDATAGDGLTLGENVIIKKDVIIGNNVVIGANVIINSGVEIGDNTVIGDNTTIGRDTIIGSDVLIGVIGGGVGVTLGKNVTVGDGQTIADGSFVPANSMIIAVALSCPCWDDLTEPELAALLNSEEWTNPSCSDSGAIASAHDQADGIPTITANYFVYSCTIHTSEGEVTLGISTPEVDTCIAEINSVIEHIDACP